MVEARLALGSRPASPTVAVDGWEQGDSVNKTTIRFGPFAEPIEVDRVLIYINHEGPDEISLGSTLRLPAGMPFVFDLSLAVI